MSSNGLDRLNYKAKWNFCRRLRSLSTKISLKRYGKPEDVAYLTVYLLSEASSWMTGSSLDITGGGEGLLI
ncbi:SDR family oxidoreductase [Bacteroides fragilis]